MPDYIESLIENNKRVRMFLKALTEYTYGKSTIEIEPSPDAWLYWGSVDQMRPAQQPGPTHSREE